MKKLIALAMMLAISSASAQEQPVWLTGELLDPNGSVEGGLDVFFSWNLTTDVASDFRINACPEAGTETVTVQGNELLVSGSCDSRSGLLNWGGSVDEQIPCSCYWVGGVGGVVTPTAAPEPRLWLLMLTGLLLTALAQ
jgi:hypothetical protein